MSRKKLIKLPIFPGKLMIIDTDSIEYLKEHTDLTRELMNGFLDSIYAHSITGGLEGRICYYIVFNTKNTHKKVTHGTIAHECLHITHYMFDIMGYESDQENDEFQAYLLDYLVEEVHKVLKI